VKGRADVKKRTTAQQKKLEIQTFSLCVEKKAEIHLSVKKKLTVYKQEKTRRRRRV
jgi:hypothetical protein